MPGRIRDGFSFCVRATRSLTFGGCRSAPAVGGTPQTVAVWLSILRYPPGAEYPTGTLRLQALLIGPDRWLRDRESSPPQITARLSTPMVRNDSAEKGHIAL